jgi:aminopeptidase N
MMKKAAGILLCILLAGYQHIIAQPILPADYCLKNKSHLNGSGAKTTVASLDEENYDIKHVKLDIELNNLSTQVKGSVTTTAISKTTFLNNYTFELTDVLTVDSVKINGQLTPLASEGIIRRALPANPIAPNTVFTAQVFYHGIAITGTAFATAGLNNDSAWNTRATFTLSEPYTAKEWWPCKQSLQDKIDSADIWITVPSELKAGSNGLLQKITTMPDGRHRYEWKTSYPIAYYLLSASVAPYTEYSFKVDVPGITDSVLVQNYIYQEPAFFAKYKAGIDSTKQMMQFLSELLGPYPFYKEKYGHCIAPFYGGMEHQTMTTQSDFGSDLTVHELGHQWFGDNVTCASWKDIWLNEGFASYIEYLFKERFRAEQKAAHMQEFHRRILEFESPRGSVYVDDTTNADRIFSGRLSYSKGAAMIHTLRFVIDNDAVFFSLLKDYQQQFSGGNATTEQFKTLVEQKTGINLLTFFDQWIYKEGYPIFSAEWNQRNGKLFLKLNQQGSVPQSVSVFKTPLEVRFSGTDKDTVIRFTIDSASQQFSLAYTPTVSGIEIDPANWVLNTTGKVERNPALGLNELTSNTVLVFPNPTYDNWLVIGLNKSYDLALTDLSGRTLWRGNNGTVKNIVVPASQYASGMYLLQLFENNKRTETIKLIKH